MSKSAFYPSIVSCYFQIQELTMGEIGREIHDNVGQNLILASLYSHQIAFENKQIDIDEKIKNIRDIIDKTIEVLRKLSKTLTDDDIKNKSLEQLLLFECEKVKSLVKCDFKTEGISPVKASYDSKNVLVRITQEFIQNSLKHAECSAIEIKLCQKNSKIQLYLIDNGKGFDLNNQEVTGIGLKNMKKRTEIINGKLELNSDSGGTKLKIEIPLFSKTT